MPGVGEALALENTTETDRCEDAIIHSSKFTFIKLAMLVHREKEKAGDVADAFLKISNRKTNVIFYILFINPVT